MYTYLKKIALNILPKKVIFKIEPTLRLIYSFDKKGINHLCSVCRFKNSKWISIENKDKLCPKCGSLSRDRRLWKLISENYLNNNSNVLDFSPSRSLFRKWKKEK